MLLCGAWGTEVTVWHIQLPIQPLPHAKQPAQSRHLAEAAEGRIVSNLKQAVEAIRLRFTSLNAVQIERAMVPVAEFDALLAALPVWQPIETAPLDADIWLYVQDKLGVCIP
jgi:hypothetical protein